MTPQNEKHQHAQDALANATREIMDLADEIREILARQNKKEEE